MSPICTCNDLAIFYSRFRANYTHIGFSRHRAEKTATATCLTEDHSVNFSQCHTHSCLRLGHEDMGSIILTCYNYRDVRSCDNPHWTRRQMELFTLTEPSGTNETPLFCRPCQWRGLGHRRLLFGAHSRDFSCLNRRDHIAR